MLLKYNAWSTTTCVLLNYNARGTTTCMLLKYNTWDTTRCVLLNLKVKCLGHYYRCVHLSATFTLYTLLSWYFVGAGPLSQGILLPLCSVESHVDSYIQIFNNNYKSYIHGTICLGVTQHGPGETVVLKQ